MSPSEFATIFNSTSAILNRTKRHDEFLLLNRLTACRIDHQIFNDRCKYLKETNHDSCFDKINIVDYTTFLFCYGTQSHLHYVFAFTLIILFCLYLFIVLGITADQFFCPALTVLAKFLRMSESLAGVTLFAFGNGAPDLFTALSDPYGDTELMYNELMGGGAFIISVVGGMIIVIKSFQVEPFKLVRDCLFFMLAISYIAYAIHDKAFTIIETSIIISIYVAYIVVILLERLFEKSNIIKLESYEPSESDEPVTVFKQFFGSLNPLDELQPDTSRIEYILIIIKAPIILTLRLLIPIVDYSIIRDGWSKLLNMLHCILLPQFLLLIIGLNKVAYYRVPLSLIVFIVSFVMCVIVGATTTKDDVPKYHLIFSMLSFVGSICVIFVVADEIMAMLNVVGQATGLSHSILGITVLSWGNSVGDLVASVVLAKKGFAKLGFYGVFGSAMFNCLCGLGITFIIKLVAAHDEVAYGREGEMGPNCTIYLFLLLTFIIIAFVMSDFWARHVIGYYLLTVYAIFILFCCLNEGGWIHPYGTDHSDQLHIRFGLLGKNNKPAYLYK